MKSIPASLGTSYIETFAKRNFEYKLGLLRKQIYEMLLQSDYSKFIDLDNFRREHLQNNTSKMKEMVEIVSSELIKLGWSVSTSYGSTALFVYVGDKPTNCYDDTI